MRFNLKLLVAFLPLVVGSPLNPHENPKKTNDASGVSVSLEDASTAPAAAAVSPEDHGFHQPRAAKTTLGTCPAKSKGTKSSKSKAGHRLSSLVRRNGQYGRLSVPTTANPLDKWATEVYKTVTQDKEVHIDFDTALTLKPTSHFAEFGDSPFYMTLTGLYGCTGVVVTSYCGAYMAHFWQDAMDEELYNGKPEDKNVFIAAVSDPLKNIQNKAAEKAANKNNAWKQALAPDSDFVSLSAHQKCLNKDMGAQAFIFTPISNSDGTKLESPSSVEALRAVVADITGLSPDKIATHTYKTPGQTKAKARTNGEGKVLLTYSPDTGATPHEHAYQVHVKKYDRPDVTMAVGDTWTGDANQCTCEASPLKVKEHDRTCCKCSVQ